MKKIFFITIFTIFSVVFIFFTTQFVEYIIKQKQNKNMIEYCAQNDTEECYTRMFELMLPKLLLHSAKVNGKNIELTWFDPDTVRIDAKEAILKSDALLGYGVYHTTGYEDKYSELFNKYSYAFDCGVPTYKPKSDKCLFFSECLASDKFLIWDHIFTSQMQISSGKIHTLKQKIKELNLEEKQIFVKIDVDEGDIAVLPEIIKNFDSITGFNIAFHIRDTKAIIDRLPILDDINEKFILIARHTYYQPNNIDYRVIKSKYYKHIINSRILYLSFINKKLLDSYSIYNNQNSLKYYNNKKVKLKNLELIDIPISDISFILTFVEKTKQLFKFNK